MSKVIKLSAYAFCISLWFYSGCSSNDEPEPFDCGTSDLALDLVSDTDPSSCAISDGSIVVLATGGKDPYQYKLDNGSFGNSATFSNLGGGSFSITVRDDNGCETLITGIVLSAPSAPVAGASTIAGNTDCLTPNGSITANVTGGATPYQYKIGSGSFGGSPTFSNLKGDNYTITVEDDNGCQITINATVASNTGVSYDAQIKPILEVNCIKSGCHNGDNGADRNWSVFANVQAKAQGIKTRTGNGSMPADQVGTGGLPQSQRDLIACWVDEGAQDN
jgi:hypothetical protein